MTDPTAVEAATPVGAESFNAAASKASFAAGVDQKDDASPDVLVTPLVSPPPVDANPASILAGSPNPAEDDASAANNAWQRVEYSPYMKTLKDQLSREEMKKVFGGYYKIKWNCYWSPGVFAGTECSLTDPAPICGLDSCTNSGSICSTPLYCL